MSRPPTVTELFSLRDRVFLVVGGAHRLGFDFSTALVEAGAGGVLTSRDADRARSAAASLAQSHGARVEGLPLDACDEAAVKALVARMHAEFGRIDIVVNCVGGGGGGMAKSSPALEERSLADWDLLHRLNTHAPFLVCKHVVPLMRVQGGGSIINVASIAGMVGRDRAVYPPEMPPQPLDYASAKAAVIGFTRDLAAYVGGDGIRVNCISPGGFERGQPRAFIDAYSRKCVLGRMGRDGVDLKGAAVFLASDASAYVTGHNLVVDGGFTIWQ